MELVSIINLACVDCPSMQPHTVISIAYLLTYLDLNRLNNDLKKVDRTVTPWIVFGAHRPMYIQSNYGT